jgi:hypothetical protein
VSLSAYISEIAIPLEPLRGAFGTHVTPTGVRLSDDGEFILLPLLHSISVRLEEAVPVDKTHTIAEATTIVRPWKEDRRQRLAGRLGELLSQLQIYLLSQEPDVRFVQNSTSLTIRLPDGRRAGVVPQPTLGLRLRVRRRNSPILVTRVSRSSDFPEALAWLRSVPPQRESDLADDDE